MNILLWTLQILLALHTIMGAVWKYSNSEQSVPSLKAIPHGVWLGLGIVELACAVGLVLPLLMKSKGSLAPLARPASLPAPDPFRSRPYARQRGRT
jgi:hypothetical protein